ncbi:LTA synthase family protein [Parasediminibacterium sp. JCM 36343]|uniref:LTA synthase family protein n=1 Tax=Parasediminibacterium sp. JCM 36343 TaxID=3374279 RepID=UPI0039799604
MVFGLRFDISTITITNSLFIVMLLVPAPFVLNQYYQKFLKYLFIVTNSIFLAINLVDVAYFPFVHKRMQFDAFRYITGSKGTDFFRLLPTFLRQFWYLALFLFFIVVFLIKTYKEAVLATDRVLPSIKNYIYSILVFLLSAGLAIIAIRGGLQVYPLSITHASEMAEVDNIPILLNAPFSVINTLDKKNLPVLDYFPENELPSYYTGIHQPEKIGSFTKQNVVVIIVEGLSKKYVSFFKGRGKTPFLDSLLGESLVFENGFANARESIQGIPAVLSSIPSWQDEPFIFSPYSTNSITSFASILHKEGYTSAFFHGGSNGTMGFDFYSKLAGFDHYYGRREYNNEKDFDGDWGIWDEPFLQYAANTMSATQQPFMSAIFTLNTHHPFTIPEKYKTIFTDNSHPMLPCVQYFDLALQRFFENASKQPWYKNTLFIITADHTVGKIAKEKSTVLEDYRIPIAFYRPDGSLKKVDKTVANQIDILPTALHILNYSKPYFSFGKDLLNNQYEHFSINYSGGIYQYIDNSWDYQFNGERGVGLYNWKADTACKNNLIENAALADSLKLREANLKKMIQVFNNDMVNNKMQVLATKK